MSIDPLALAFADDLTDLATRVFPWWRGAQRAPPSLVFRVDDFGPQVSTMRQIPALAWPPDLADRPLVVVSASGGVDSTAATLLARARWPDALMVLVRADTGKEPEDSDRILRELARWVRAPVVTLLPFAGEDLFDLIRTKGYMPNRLSSPWCSQTLKGYQLDKFSAWLVWGRKPGTTVHVAGLLPNEQGRIRKQAAGTRKRFGNRMVEHAVLAEARVDKAGARALIEATGLPISETYRVRARHGCLPCRWWEEAQWRDFFRLLPDEFYGAAALEEEIGATGKQRARRGDKKLVGAVSAKKNRVWLLGDDNAMARAMGFETRKRREWDKKKGKTVTKYLSPRKVQFPDGLTLREWLAVWDTERPGWRRVGLETEDLETGCGVISAEEQELAGMRLVKLGRR